MITLRCVFKLNLLPLIMFLASTYFKPSLAARVVTQLTFAACGSDMYKHVLCEFIKRK